MSSNDNDSDFSYDTGGFESCNSDIDKYMHSHVVRKGEKGKLITKRKSRVKKTYSKDPVKSSKNI